MCLVPTMIGMALRRGQLRLATGESRGQGSACGQNCLEADRGLRGGKVERNVEKNERTRDDRSV